MLQEPSGSWMPCAEKTRPRFKIDVKPESDVGHGTLCLSCGRGQVRGGAPRPPTLARAACPGRYPGIFYPGTAPVDGGIRLLFHSAGFNARCLCIFKGPVRQASASANASVNFYPTQPPTNKAQRHPDLSCPYCRPREGYCFCCLFQTFSIHDRRRAASPPAT